MMKKKKQRNPQQVKPPSLLKQGVSQTGKINATNQLRNFAEQREQKYLGRHF